VGKPDEYMAHARHCMDMADQARHDDDKRSWVLLAETWMEMLPDRENGNGSFQRHGTQSRVRLTNSR
jgi:hypothetical protein